MNEKVLYHFIYRVDNKKQLTKPIVSLYLTKKEHQRMQAGFQNITLAIGKHIIDRTTGEERDDYGDN